MAIFFNKDVHELLQNRKVIVIGDSIQRSVYKDLVCLWTQGDSRYLYQRELRAKGELSFLGDKLLSGGKLEGKMVNGTGYREVREFSDGEVSFKYYFVTRSYSEHMASILNELKTSQPDIIVMNSTFWDLHHYGDSDLQQYKANLDRLLTGITEMFSSSLLFIWNAALPLAERCKGGFLRKGFLTIPVDKIKTANKFAWLATTERKKIYLDLFTELKNKENFTQAEDGIHWGMRAHRKISNLILTEVCTSWNKKIPDPPPMPNKAGNRNSSPVPWSSFYPDSDEDYWNSPPPNSYNEEYELEYYYVPYWNSPLLGDRYQTPSPLHYGSSSPYGNSWGNFGMSYSLPFVSARAREYQPIHTAGPYIFQNRYPPIEEMNFNFSTPPLPYQGNYLFKPASYSDPFPSRSFSPFVTNQFRSLPVMGQGLLPTPPPPSSFTFFTEGSSSYRDRFKKLGNPSVRGRRYRSSTATHVGTPLNTAQNTKQSVTPQNSFVNHGAGSTPAVNSSDLNNNDEQKSSVAQPCSESNSENIAVETGLPPELNPKSSTNSAASEEGSDSGPTLNGEDTSDRDEGDKTCGTKRKRDDDEVVGQEDLNPCKVARGESTITDANRCGIKRKLEDDKPAEEPNVVKNVQETGEPNDDDAERYGLKKRRVDDDTVEESKSSQIFHAEKSSMDDSKNQKEESLFPSESNSTGVALDKGTTHDLVRCSLTYDSFI